MHCINLYSSTFHAYSNDLLEEIECPIDLQPMEDPVSLVPCMHKINYIRFLQIITADSQNRRCPLCLRSINQIFHDSILKDAALAILRLQECAQKKKSFEILHTVALEALSTVQCPYHKTFPRSPYLIEAQAVRSTTYYTRFNAKNLPRLENNRERYTDIHISRLTKKLLEMYQLITRNVVTLLNQIPYASLYFRHIVAYLTVKEIASFGRVCTLWYRWQQSDRFWDVSQRRILKDDPLHIHIIPPSSFTYVYGRMHKAGPHLPFKTLWSEFYFSCNNKNGLFTAIYFSIFVDSIEATFYFPPTHVDRVKKYLKETHLDVWSDEKGIFLCVQGELVVNFDQVPFFVFYTLFQDFKIPPRSMTMLYREILKRKRFLAQRKNLL